MTTREFLDPIGKQATKDVKDVRATYKEALAALEKAEKDCIEANIARAEAENDRFKAHTALAKAKKDFHEALTALPTEGKEA